MRLYTSQDWGILRNLYRFDHMIFDLIPFNSWQKSGGGEINVSRHFLFLFKNNAQHLFPAVKNVISMSKYKQQQLVNLIQKILQTPQRIRKEEVLYSTVQYSIMHDANGLCEFYFYYKPLKQLSVFGFGKIHQRDFFC